MSEFEDAKAILNAAAQTENDDNGEELQIDDESQLLEGEESNQDENLEQKNDESDQDDTEFNLNDDYNVSDLSKAIGVEAEDIYNMQISLSEGHKPVRLGDIKDSFQTVNHENEELKSQLESQAEQIQQAQAGLTQNQQVSNEMMQVQGEIASIQQQFNGINWADEEAENPGHAALMRQKLNEQYQSAQNKAVQLDQLQSQQKQQFLAGQHKKMYEILPEWKDDAVKRADQDLIRSTLKNNGYSDDEINKIADPTVLKMVRRLAQFEANELKAKEVVKAVVKTPKVLRGKGRFKANKISATEKAVAKAHKTKNKHDELDAARALLSGRI